MLELELFWDAIRPYVSSTPFIVMVYALLTAYKTYTKRRDDKFERVMKREIATQCKIIYGKGYVDMQDRICSVGGNIMVSTIKGSSPVPSGTYLENYEKSLSRSRKSSEIYMWDCLIDDKHLYRNQRKVADYIKSFSSTTRDSYLQQLGSETGTSSLSKSVEANSLSLETFTEACCKIIIKAVDIK